MDQNETLMKGSTVYAPLTGLAVALEEVPDPVFAGKVLGDGIGIIPSEGKIAAPVDGTLVTIADTQHAFGFQTEDGLNILVHVGLDTVELKGEGFTVYAKENDKVKKGDLIAEVNLEFLKEKGINPTTPVIIC